MSKIFSIILVCAILSVCTVGVAYGADINDTGCRYTRTTHVAKVYDNGIGIIDKVTYDDCNLVYQMFENANDKRWFNIAQGNIVIVKGYGYLTRVVPSSPGIAYWLIEWETTKVQ